MDAAALESLARAWIDEQAAGQVGAASERVMDLERDDPETCWAAILAIHALEPSEQVAVNLAAGPLESLLAHHGARVIDRVELRARQDPAFRRLLNGVWKNLMSDAIWERVDRARVRPPERSADAGPGRVRRAAAPSRRGRRRRHP